MEKKILLSLFFVQVLSHSWLECTMYTGDLEYFEPDKCLGRPRPLAGGRNVGGTFGQDIGMDFRPQAGGSRCQGSPTSGTPTQVTYEAGKTYTLAWAPKNHVAATCTNAFIPDNFLRVYMAPYDGQADPSQDTFKQNQVKASFSDDPHVSGQIDFKGFQNCPKFCEDTDKSLCTGTITIPESADAGVYTFQWYWAFNSQTDLYATCWEAEVTAATNVGGTPTNAPEPTSPGSTATPATPINESPCFNCCQPKEEFAQGTGQMLTIPAFERGTFKYMECPEGYEGELKYMCLEDILASDEARLVDGECTRKLVCSEDQQGTVVLLSLALTFTILAFIFYVLFEKEILTWDMFCNDSKSTSSPQSFDVERSVPQPPQKVVNKDTARPSVAYVENTDWHYVNENDETVGPVSTSAFKQWVQKIGWETASQTFVWNGKEIEEWTQVTEVPELCRQVQF